MGLRWQATQLWGDLRGLPTRDAHKFVVGSRKDVVRVASGRPDRFKVTQHAVDDSSDWRRVTDGGNATDRLTRCISNEVWSGTLNAGCGDQFGQ